MRLNTITIVFTVVAFFAGAGAGATANGQDATLQSKVDTAVKMQRLLDLNKRAERGEALQEKAEWAAQGRAQRSWTRRVKFWAQKDAAMLRRAEKHPVSPLGLIMRDLEEAVAAGDEERAQKLLDQARKVHGRAEGAPAGR